VFLEENGFVETLEERKNSIPRIFKTLHNFHTGKLREKASLKFEAILRYIAGTEGHFITEEHSMRRDIT